MVTVMPDNGVLCSNGPFTSGQPFQHRVQHIYPVFTFITVYLRHLLPGSVSLGGAARPGQEPGLLMAVVLPSTGYLKHEQ
jgi:hypothetical protein